MPISVLFALRGVAIPLTSQGISRGAGFVKVDKNTIGLQSLPLFRADKGEGGTDFPPSDSPLGKGGKSLPLFRAFLLKDLVKWLNS
jgi:hypothetical protein